MLWHGNHAKIRLRLRQERLQSLLRLQNAKKETGGRKNRKKEDQKMKNAGARKGAFKI